MLIRAQVVVKIHHTYPLFFIRVNNSQPYKARKQFWFADIRVMGSNNAQNIIL